MQSKYAVRVAEEAMHVVEGRMCLGYDRDGNRSEVLFCGALQLLLLRYLLANGQMLL